MAGRQLIGPGRRHDRRPQCIESAIHFPLMKVALSHRIRVSTRSIRSRSGPVTRHAQRLATTCAPPRRVGALRVDCGRRDGARRSGLRGRGRPDSRRLATLMIELGSLRAIELGIDPE